MAVRNCAIAGCTRSRHNGKVCKSHDTIIKLGLPMAERVWVARRLANVERIGDCIIWQGAPNNMGYGKVGVLNDPSSSGEEEAVHRWFYKRFVGPLAADKVLDHLCRTPLCVNVEHLEPVTLAENTRRGFESRGLGSTRTHCKHGHPWTPENIRRVPGRNGNSFQKCHPCQVAQDRARHLTKRERERKGS